MGYDIEQIKDLAKNAIKVAMDADEVEVFAMAGRSISVETHKTSINLAKESKYHGMGIRAVVNGAVGFASTNDLNRITDAVKMAISSARLRGGDSDWKSLPKKQSYPNVSAIFDSKIEALDLNAAIDCALLVLDGAQSVDGTIPMSGSFGCSSSTTYILNSNDVEVEESATSVSAHFEALAKDSAVSSASEFDVSRHFDLDLSAIGEKAAILAKKSLNGTNIETMQTTVLLRPNAISDLLNAAFLPSVDAESVQKGRSVLAKRIGEKVIGENISFIDDGLLAGGIGTSISDDEGTPSQRTELITDGILNTYLYDSYAAGKDNVESTGNGVRNSYGSTPSVGITNMVFKTDSYDIIGDTAHGVIIDTIIGAHTANSLTGDFSVECRNAFLVENGEITKPIQSLMISANIFDVLNNITGMGTDVRSIGGIVVPTVRFEKMQIVG